MKCHQSTLSAIFKLCSPLYRIFPLSLSLYLSQSLSHTHTHSPSLSFSPSLTLTHSLLLSIPLSLSQSLSQSPCVCVSPLLSQGHTLLVEVSVGVGGTNPKGKDEGRGRGTERERRSGSNPLAEGGETERESLTKEKKETKPGRDRIRQTMHPTQWKRRTKKTRNGYHVNARCTSVQPGAQEQGKCQCRCTRREKKRRHADVKWTSGSVIGNIAGRCVR